MIRQDLSIDIGVDAIASRPTTAYLGAMAIKNEIGEEPARQRANSCLRRTEEDVIDTSKYEVRNTNAIASCRHLV